MLSGMPDSRARNSGLRLVPAPSEGLCLDFANTRNRRPSEQAPGRETLAGLADLLAWCETAGSIDHAAAVGIEAWAKRRGREAASLVAEVVALREAVYAAFAAASAGRPIAKADAETLNRALAGAPGRTNLMIAEAANTWRLPAVTPIAASLLAPVLWSAGDLLAGSHLQKVRLCANEKCRWLFLDDSKSGTRRWCSMSSCGNRAKAHRHYMRKIKAESAAAG
jgi:predicted RNA-binding Zn ribbon-like protein